jgi:hypothetical protein
MLLPSNSNCALKNALRSRFTHLAALRAIHGLALCLLLHVELMLVDDVLGEVLVPRFHGALVYLGDGELALSLAVV